MNHPIKLNTRGVIKQGAHPGWYVLIVDDTNGTGGYYVFLSNRADVKGMAGVPDGAEGYDNWFESQEQLWSFIEHSRWMIEWE